MPVTWCYDVEGDQKYCSPGFPIGCYVTKEGRGKDACVTSVSVRTAYIMQFSKLIDRLWLLIVNV